MPREQQKHRADRVLADVEWATVGCDNLTGLLLEHLDPQLGMIEKLPVPVFCTLHEKGVVVMAVVVVVCGVVNIKAALVTALAVNMDWTIGSCSYYNIPSQDIGENARINLQSKHENLDCKVEQRCTHPMHHFFSCPLKSISDNQCSAVCGPRIEKELDKTHLR